VLEERVSRREGVEERQPELLFFHRIGLVKALTLIGPDFLQNYLAAGNFSAGWEQVPGR
jgi:hypothetical protein